MKTEGGGIDEMFEWFLSKCSIEAICCCVRIESKNVHYWIFYYCKLVAGLIVLAYITFTYDLFPLKVLALVLGLTCLLLLTLAALRLGHVMTGFPFILYSICQR